MHDSEHVEPSRPVPIDAGRVAQAIVEYTGKRMGTVTYRGPSSGREYRFDASPSGKSKYVLDEDLELFRLLQDFQVLEVGRIDPEAEERERRERELAELRAQLEENRSREGRVVTEVAKLLDDYEKQKERRHGDGPHPPVDGGLQRGHQQRTAIAVDIGAQDEVDAWIAQQVLSGAAREIREQAREALGDRRLLWAEALAHDARHAQEGLRHGKNVHVTESNHAKVHFTTTLPIGVKASLGARPDHGSVGRDDRLL